MALTLVQMQKGTIVDRVCEWGEDGKERPMRDVLRGIIVKVDGDSEQEQVDALFVSYGPKKKIQLRDMVVEQKEKVTINDVTVPCVRAKAAELIEVFPYDSTPAKQAWRRLFRIPVQVGLIGENRKASASRGRRRVDALQLTPAPKEGPVSDADESGMEGLPEEEA